MQKLNCWEFMKCGREPGGRMADKLGVCNAAVETSTHGINDGKNGGRACWALSGTFCEGRVQGTFASKLDNCRKCEFFKTVRREENFAFQDTRKIRQAYIIGNYAYYMGEGYKELLERKHRVPAKEGFARL